MENAIPQRVYDFLKNYPPFSLLEEGVLLDIAAKVKIRYVQEQSLVFTQGEEARKEIYLVKEGAIHLLHSTEGENQLVEVCDQGEIFGLRPLAGTPIYTLSAKAVEESLLYVIPTAVLLPIIEAHPKVAWYFAQSFAAGNASLSQNKQDRSLFSAHPSPVDKAFELVEIQSIGHSKKPVTCSLNTSIRDAAQTMRSQNVGSIVITNQENVALGILTDRDLRNKVVTGDIGLEQAVSEIMSHPVITMTPQLTVADVQILMMKHGIHHLVLTENGTNTSPIVGVISEHDLLVIQGNNPAVLIREIKRCNNGQELKMIREKAEMLLKKYLFQEVAIGFISSMITQVNDAIIVRAIQLAEEALAEEGHLSPGIRWCWLALGSEGREEQLLRTDQDSALVFEDVQEDRLAITKAYFLQLAQKITKLLFECGFDYCPGDMMASNPAWCLPLSSWKKQFSAWILTPTQQHVLYSNIFFDFRPIWGHWSLADELTTHIFDTIGKRETFLSFMAKNALQNAAPLTFFRQFMVERGGEHKDQFDIKGRAMMPLADAARVLILSAQLPQVNNTFRRFDKLAELEPQNRALFEQAADAYEILVRYRALQGLKNNTSGRYFKPSELSKMERLNLRNSFKPLRELQDLLTVRFRLNFLI